MKSELDRILKSDLSEYKIAVSQHSSTLDHFEECLTERSNFIHSFNEMLKRELGKVDANVVVSNVGAQEAKTKNEQAQRNSKGDDGLKIKIRAKISEKVKSIFKDQIKEVKNVLQNLIETMKKQVFDDSKAMLETVINKITSNYQQQIKKLEIQLTNTKLELESLKTQQKKRSFNQTLKLCELQQFSPPKQPHFHNEKNHLTFNMEVSTQKSLSEWSQSALYTHRSSKLQDYKQKLSDSTPSNKMQIKNSSGWKHYVCQLDQKCMKIKPKMLQFTEKGQPNFPSLLKSKKPISYNIPTFKTITISNPPIQSGFSSQLKLGNSVSYRGMWKNKKFHGKGKLILGEYSYEGDFQYGMFHGRGCLKYDNCEFLGQFLENKAEGEGKLTINNKTITGRWKNNIFVQA